MTHGTFIFADLSTLNQDRAKQFYHDLMGWTYKSEDYAETSGGTALFSMPEKFVEIGLPSFWMSYIAVDDLDAAVQVAEENGGRIEIRPTIQGTGRFALLRDPLGAGFTMWEGPGFGDPGDRHGHALFVSDAQAVIPFYEALFGWTISDTGNALHEIKAHGQLIAHLHEIPDPNIRGKEEYWAVLLSTPSLENARRDITKSGGSIVSETPLPEGHALVARDPDGAAFFLIEKATKSKPPYLAWIGFYLIFASIVLDITWLWSIFLGIWIFTALKDRETWLFERVTRKDNPMLYWAILIAYAVLAVFSVIGIS